MPTLEPWGSSNVALLGDYVHNITTMSGMGANTALRDAEVLTRCIIDFKARRFEVVEGVWKHEGEMRS
jgi:2-polyprenyl-6-methoxyphenol hydroxylase-like FAD-dependent oxidoreductase